MPDPKEGVPLRGPRDVDTYVKDDRAASDDEVTAEVSIPELSCTRLGEALSDLRATLLPEAPPEPSRILQAAFRDGLGDTPPLAGPVPWSPARRRRSVAAGIAATVLLGGAGVAQALPGPAQSAFDWTADIVGLDPRDDQPVSPADPVEIDAPQATPIDPGGSAPQDGFAEEDVVPDATDPASPGIDDPAALSEDAREQAPATTPPTGPPDPAPAPEPPAADRAQPDTTPAGGETPADQIDPGRSSAGTERGAPPIGGKP